jgi:hypothetical protein
MLYFRARKIYIILGTKIDISYIGAVNKGGFHGTKRENVCWTQA